MMASGGVRLNRWPCSLSGTRKLRGVAAILVKEHKMKKILFVFVVASLLLTACGGGAKPAAQQGPVEITFTMWGAPEELQSGRQ